MDKIRKQSGKSLSMRLKPTVMVQACSMALAVLGSGCLGNASAGNFVMENGDQGQWTLGMSIGSGMRTRGADPALISTGNGGLGGFGNDDGDLNYQKGNLFSTVAKVSGELQMKHDNLGFVLGGKGWYDYTQKRTNVEHGSFNNGYAVDSKLSDDGFYSGTEFSGAALGNAYVYGRFEPIEGKPITVKLGNQVVNWGESLFIPGINQSGAFDIASSHQAGATVKELLLPIPQLTANIRLGEGISVGGFYQIKWARNLADGCGTYWSVSDAYNCSGGSLQGGDSLGTDRTQFAGVPALGGLNFKLGFAPEQKPKDSGQYGFSTHYYADSISTDFGVYYVNYHQRTPVISLSKTATADPASLWSGNYFGLLGPNLLSLITPTRAFWDSSAENIKAVGMSAATEVGGWSVSGEASYTKGIPVQINPGDMLVGLLLGAGPMGALAALPANSVIHGYDLKNKTQLQVSTVRILPYVAGADSLTLAGEVGLQHWYGIGDPATSTRYGFGSTVNNEGYATSNAWGYRLQAELSYPNAVVDWTLKPRVFWSHDVKGYSADGTFSQDRQALGLALRGEYMKKYYAEISYTGYNRSATYDIFHDRDYVAVVAGINF